MNIKHEIEKCVKNKKTNSYLLNVAADEKAKALKNNSLNSYYEWRSIEHSLYRYNSLMNSKIFDAAEKEGKHLLNLTKNLNSDGEGVVLKGGITNTRYIWKSEPNACEECQELDGKEYEFEGDIPEKPHPNCKCSVIEVPVDDEECDCIEFFNELEHTAENIEAAKKDMDYIGTYIQDALSLYSNVMLINLGYSIVSEIDIAMNAYHDFQKNKAEMIAYKGYDKYHHAKANCEATKRGLTGEAMAYTLSYGKEVYDIIKKVIVDGMKFEKAWNDSMEDLQADMYGINAGHQDGACSVNVENVGNIINKLN